MPTEITRCYLSTNPITFTSDIATTGGFGMNCFSGGMLYVVSGTATLTFRVAPSEATPPASMHTVNAADLTLAVAPGKAYPLPDDLFGANYVRLVSSGPSVVAHVTLKG